jgi:hypothetical protein
VANFYIIAQKTGGFDFTFYGRGVISSFDGVIDGSVDGQYCEDGFYKRIGRNEQKLKIFFSPASGHVRKYLYPNFDVPMYHSLVVKRYELSFRVSVNDTINNRKPALRALKGGCSGYYVNQK